MQPRLMLFDEPTSALDPELVGEVLEVMKSLAAEGMTMLDRHPRDGLRRYTSPSRIAFIDEGRIIDRTVAESPEPAAQFLLPSRRT